MTEPLENRLLQLRRRVRQVVWLYGLSGVVVVVFGAALFVGLLDWAFHLDDPGVRLILGVTILAAGTYVAWRYLARPLRRPLSDVDLAMRIEQRFPGFQDSFASTVQFLERRTDPTLGSPELQQNVIRETIRQADGVNLADVIETRGVRRLVGVAVAICLTVALIVGLNQAEAGIALNRLVFPFAGIDWPKTTDLRLMTDDFDRISYGDPDPIRLARGDVLTLYVENVKGPLPDDLHMEYLFADEEVVRDRLRKVSRRDAQGRMREVGVARVVATRGPMWFRAVGGDDRDKPMFELEVVPPPLLEELQVILTPPAYSGREVETLPPGVGHVQGLVGTQVEIAARVNKPLKSASLRVRNRSPQPIELTGDARELKARFDVDEPGVYSYWFDLQDQQNFENPDAPRYEIRGIADLPPDIDIERPATDQYVTAKAEVPLKFLAHDDLGLKDVRLHFKLRDTQESLAEPRLMRDGSQTGLRPADLVVEEVWALSELPLAPGMRIVFYAEATDDFDLGPEHVGRSISRVLTIVSPAEKQAELASRQSDLLDELDRLFKAQSRAREHVGELETQLNTVGSLRPEDVDLLKRIELDQRQISSQLLNPLDGVEARTQKALAELRNNKIDDPGMSLRLHQIVDELSLLREEYLPAVEQDLTRARKAANMGIRRDPPQSADEADGGEETSAEVRSADGKDSSQEDSSGWPPQPNSIRTALDGQDESGILGEQSAALTRAGANQDAVLESLDVMRQRLTQWRNRNDVMRDLDDLLAGQEQIGKDAAEIGRRTLARDIDQLTPQEEADLAKVAERQRGQSDRLQELRNTLNELAGQPPAGSTSGGQLLRDAQDHIESRAIGGRMRQVADELQRNNVGLAAAGQQQILDDLQELRDILNDRGVHDSETLVKQLQQAEAELSTLRKRQEQLRKAARDAERLSDRRQRERELERLRKLQQQLREDVARLSRKLRRLQARRPSDAAGRAARRMGQAEERLGGGDPTTAADQQREALDDLEQAQRELAAARQQAQERLARELLERMGDELKSMIALEQSVIDETRRLDAEHATRGSWSKAQLKSLLDLRETQRQLKQDTDRLVDSLQAVEVFALALRGASREMQKAVDRLADRQTGEKTVQAEQAAKRRFVELVAALEPEETAGQAPPMGGAGADQNVGADDAVPQLAQLKMIKTLQESLLRKTALLDQRRLEGGGLTREELEELEEIADEQGRLADLARNLMRAFTEPMELEPQPVPSPEDR